MSFDGWVTATINRTFSSAYPGKKDILSINWYLGPTTVTVRDGSAHVVHARFGESAPSFQIEKVKFGPNPITTGKYEKQSIILQELL